MLVIHAYLVDNNNYEAVSVFTTVRKNGIAPFNYLFITISLNIP